MPTNRDVENFLELRQGFQGMADFADAALRFLDRNGIALMTRSNGVRANGIKRLGPALRERVKRHYTKRRQRETIEAIDPVREVSPAKRGPTSYGQKKIEGRRLSARVLDALDRTEPRQPIPEGARSIGALVRRGYARKKGNGYIRTAKVFTVGEAPEAPSAGNGAAPDSNMLTVTQAAKIIGVSDTYVRSVARDGRLASHQELRVRRGMNKPVPTIVFAKEDVERFAAESGQS